jgi:hypothetical protein
MHQFMRWKRLWTGMFDNRPPACIKRWFFAGAYCPDALALNQPRSIELSVPLLPDPHAAESVVCNQRLWPA